MLSDPRSTTPTPSPSGRRGLALAFSLVNLGLTLTAVGCGGGGGTRAEVAAPPSFSAGLVDQTALVGGTATFSAAASGAATYQWYRAGIPIPGATGMSYTTPALTAADDNTVYAITARNSGGTTLSSYATLHVNHVQVTSQPVSQAVANGQDATFRITAVGSGTLSYQWLKDGRAIPSATQTTYVLHAVDVTKDLGDYTCQVVSTLNGTSTGVVSAAGALSLAVSAVPTITQQPQGGTVVAGETFSFHPQATEATSYQWYRNGVLIQGATGAGYTIPPAMTVDDQADYTVVASNTLGSVTSAPARLRVNYARITGQPSGGYFPEGQDATLTLGVATSGVTTFSWSKDGLLIPGATSASLGLPSLTLAQGGVYECQVTSALNGTVVQASSLNATVGVVPKPVITKQPVGATIIEGKPLVLMVEATVAGGTVLSYRWQKNGVDIPNATGNSYALTSSTQGDTGDYTCTVINVSHSVQNAVTSQAAHVVVNGAPVILSQPADLSLFEGQSATFTVSATGSGTLTYQWSRGGVVIPGAVTPSYTVPSVALTDSGATFSCTIVNGTLPNGVTRTATLTVRPAPAVGELKASRTTLTQGQGVVFTHLYNNAATATFGPAGGPFVPVASGAATTVFPLVDTTYVLNVTLSGVLHAFSVPVSVKIYVPKQLYVVNRDSNDIYRFPVNANAALINQSATSVWDYGINNPSDGLVQDADALHVATGAQPVHISATQDQKYLYVCNNGDGTLSGYAPDGTGTLQAVPGSPFALPAGYTKPWCAEVDPAGQRLYVSCAEGIAVFTVNGADGSLTASAGLSRAIPGKGQGDLIIHPSGNWLYLADSGHSVVKAFALDGTGALAPVGADMPVTFASGYDQSTQLDAHNPTALVFNKEAGLIYTRSTDITHGTTNGAVDVFAVDPYTGALSHRGTSMAEPDSLGFPLVFGKSSEFHGLAYTTKPGVDHLFNTFRQSYGAFDTSQYFQEWCVDHDSASPQFGLLSGFYGSHWRYRQLAEPWYTYNNTARPHAGTSVVTDRSGLLLVMLTAWTTNDLMVFGSDANGDISWMGTALLGEVARKSGSFPVHGVFLGTLQ